MQYITIILIMSKKIKSKVLYLSYFQTQWAFPAKKTLVEEVYFFSKWKDYYYYIVTMDQESMFNAVFQQFISM